MSTQKKRKVKPHPPWKAHEVHGLTNPKGPLTCWTIYPEQLESMVEQVAEALANRSGFTILNPKAPGMIYRREAELALAAIGLQPARRGKK